MVIVLFSVLISGAQIGFAWSRMKNIGMDPALCLLLLVPIFGLIVHVRCLIFQENYEETKRLDQTGKALLWVTFAILVVPFLLAMIVGVLGGILGA